MNRRQLSLLALLPFLTACDTLGTAFGRDPTREPVRIVFFNEDSDTLDDAARAVVVSAAEAAKRYNNVRVNVFGYAGPAGGDDVGINVAGKDAKIVAPNVWAKAEDRQGQRVRLFAARTGG